MIELVPIKSPLPPCPSCYSGSHFSAIQSSPHPAFEYRKRSPLRTHGEGLGVRLKNVLHANENCYILLKWSKMDTAVTPNKATSAVRRTTIAILGLCA